MQVLLIFSGRTNSPIPNIDANALSTACKCITSAEPAGTNGRNVAAIAKAARLESFVSGKCSSASGSPISKEFKSSSSFCSFFNSFERHDSPIPNLNVPAKIELQILVSNPKASLENFVDDHDQIQQQVGRQEILYIDQQEIVVRKDLVKHENILEQDFIFQQDQFLKQEFIFDFNLRIEGATDTIYEGLITTGPMDITTPSGGTHTCNGLNNGANPNAAGTAITCLAASGSLCNFDFDGTYNNDFQDFFISSIGSSTQTSTQFWGLLLDGQFTPNGGCQTEPKDGDDLLWAYDAFNVETFLQVEPRNVVVAAGSEFTFTVTDSQSQQAISGANFNGMVSDGNGQVTVSFPTTGEYRYKATRLSALRSNGVVITVV
ncbi:hypothetical protein D6D01_06509 [Aureobasidium pullulans]|uniref:Transcobalamin-like C-terminal domain-containing protein n=1 Tax=Aureobasidium pullulans TaxID=5580 RepID=A0A4S9KYG5_AURPU|nr:hypothetical protein D6D01_06509 [Aureobasidium pullulans]